MELLLVFAILVNGAVIYTSCFYLDLVSVHAVVRRIQLDMAVDTVLWFSVTFIQGGIICTCPRCLLLTAVWFGVQDTAQTVLGATGNFMVTFLYISPLATMVKVIRTRNAESIDPYFGAGQVRDGLTHPQARGQCPSVGVSACGLFSTLLGSSFIWATRTHMGIATLRF
jgi:hypothetical protein